MSDTTLNKIKAHLKQSEGEPEHPYLDIKGSVTIGVGFKTDTADEFANLDLQVFKGGKWVTANGDEKRQAFQKMQEAKENRNGNFSPNADFYIGKTNIRMAESDQDAELD
jgi:GH24 family phage-related lysozyme (muramidase)